LLRSQSPRRIPRETSPSSSDTAPKRDRIDDGRNLDSKYTYTYTENSSGKSQLQTCFESLKIKKDAKDVKASWDQLKSPAFREVGTWLAKVLYEHNLKLGEAPTPRDVKTSLDSGHDFLTTRLDQCNPCNESKVVARYIRFILDSYAANAEMTPDKQIDLLIALLRYCPLNSKCHPQQLTQVIFCQQLSAEKQP
jgi:hypothetical protein